MTFRVFVTLGVPTIVILSRGIASLREVIPESKDPYQLIDCMQPCSRQQLGRIA